MTNGPGVNVYEEGVFVQGDVIHTNEFFTKYLMIEAQIRQMTQTLKKLAGADQKRTVQS